MRVTAILSRVLGLLLLAPLVMAAGPRPRFELVPLGVSGGELEGDSSSFLLRRPGDRTSAVMIDAGSPVSGIMRWKGVDSGRCSSKIRVDTVLATLDHTRAIVLTHAHLDHILGLSLMSPLVLEKAFKGVTTPVYANRPTVDTIMSSLFTGQLWSDFTRIPSEKTPTYRLNVLAEGAPARIGAFVFEPVRLAHPVASSGFFISTEDGATYLHLGDTGPTGAVWDRARPILAAGRLRAVSIECSFPAHRATLAVKSGHLTPPLLVFELAKLAGLGALRQPDPELFSMADARDLVPRLAPRLAGVRILVTHIKILGRDKLVRELEMLRRAGLSLEILEQAAPVLF
ncbi:MAG: 3',5'-cyclic-nucleotide phosphodiesterase [Candidatus Riflebacteria bacterium]|nr:3',5'-cyclic-nucleotide phosphodiesterase [Candidatus Riflebacteria bacterium]